MKKRVYVATVPKSGVVLKWGREYPREEPDIMVSWAPGSKALAYAMSEMLSDHQDALLAAGLDLSTLKITAEHA